jgi:glutathione reductase (NADPH)
VRTRCVPVFVLREDALATHDYDLLVLGAGSGGLAASKRAAGYGARVAIVEQDRVGGTCVIRGCVPKKLMVYAGDLGHAVEDAAGYGWSEHHPTLDWKKLVARRDDAVANLERRHEELLAAAGVTLIRGQAKLLASGEAEVDGRRLRPSKILVATGATPVLPAVDGIEHAITSDGFFELREKPRSIAIIGGGYIAVELASILRALGSDVTLIYRAELPLRGFDEDIRRELAAALAKSGISVRAATTVASIRREASGVCLDLRGPDGSAELRTDHALLYATGRSPRTAGLGLESLGIATGPQGEVVTDEQANTNVANVFAVGDVTGRIALTPVAIQAARLWADRVFGGKDVLMSYENVPTAVFCDPPIGTVGLSETEAIQQLGTKGVRTFSVGFTPMIHSLTARKTRTFVKLVVDATTDRVLGCHIIGKDAAEIIQGFGVAVQAGATKRDFDATVGIHPSSAEEFVTLT